MRYKTDPLHSLTGIIYLIENTQNKRCYIGQTVRTFCSRYSGGRWWDTVSNHDLREDVKRYGKDAFVVKLLEHGKTLAELNQLEHAYALQYHAYKPIGYNRQRCGGNRPLANISLLHGSPPVELNDPTGKDVCIENIAAFCDDHGLEKRRIWFLIHGKTSYHRGWTPKGVTNKEHHNARHYTLYREDGTVYHVTNLNRFCREHGLDRMQMMHLVNRKVHQIAGFALSLGAFTKQIKRYIVTLEKDGKEVTFSSIKKQCRAFGLHPRFVYDLKNGRLKEYNGWTLKHVEQTFGRLKIFDQ